MAHVFPWQKGKKATFDDLTAEMDKRFGPQGTVRKSKVFTSVPTPPPPKPKKVRRVY